MYLISIEYMFAFHANMKCCWYCLDGVVAPLALVCEVDTEILNFFNCLSLIVCFVKCLVSTLNLWHDCFSCSQDFVLLPAVFFYLAHLEMARLCWFVSCLFIAVILLSQILCCSIVAFHSCRKIVFFVGGLSAFIFLLLLLHFILIFKAQFKCWKYHLSLFLIRSLTLLSCSLSKILYLLTG